MQTIPGVTSVGMADWLPLSNGSGEATLVFKDETTDLRPGNAAATPMILKVSTEYFRAARTIVLSGRTFTLHDDKGAPLVAVINQEFARKIFGSSSNSIGRFFKMRDGTRVQVVGVVESGKYASLNEDPESAVFVPLLQSPSSDTWIIIRAQSESQQVVAEIKNKLRQLDSGLPCYIQTWQQGLNLPLFPARMATISLGILGFMGALLSITGIFGIAAYSVSKRMRELGIRMALGAQRNQVLAAALGRAIKLLTYGSLAGLVMGIFATRVLASIVYQATPRDPLVLSAAILGMSLLGLFATWIPAQRALSVEPLILLREE
jgi:ABC-type antimicrobial peptide transport system permease subunit